MLLLFILIWESLWRFYSASLHLAVENPRVVRITARYKSSGIPLGYAPNIIRFLTRCWRKLFYRYSNEMKKSPLFSSQIIDFQYRISRHGINILNFAIAVRWIGRSLLKKLGQLYQILSKLIINT